jgi:hypothetical protein
MAALALLIAVAGVLGLGIFPSSWVDLARSSTIGLSGLP